MINSMVHYLSFRVVVILVRNVLSWHSNFFSIYLSLGFILRYKLTPQGRILLEHLIATQLVKKFSTLCENQKSLPRYRISPLVHKLSQTNSVHPLPLYFFRIHPLIYAFIFQDVSSLQIFQGRILILFSSLP
jgi:hypothetical protein